MLFPEEDAPLLKAWIVKRIENTSDADSDVLAEYVIALLKHDGDAASVRKLCEQEIPDFLTEDSKAFLDDVFQAITYKSYLPNAPPPPPKTTPRMSAQPPIATNVDASRKRQFDDHADLPYDDRDGYHGSAEPGRAVKQARRGRRGERGGDDRYSSGSTYPPLGMPPGMMPHFDPNNPMEAILQMQAMGMPFPQMPDFSQGRHSSGRRGRGNQPRRKGRCRDFDTKGYCSRGSTCMYDHGNEPMFLPTAEDYDPSTALLNPFGLMPDLTTQARGRKGRGRGGRKGSSRAPFSADGPVSDRSKSTIVVENIPEDSFSEDQVKGFFSQFGTIMEVSMQPYKHLAIVKYDNWAAANEAYRSPKVIFDNRFVKVFWYKDEKDKLPPSVANGSGFDPSAARDALEVEPEMDMEEFRRKQEEAQQQYQQREEKRSELEKQRLELVKQQQELLAKHQAESERLRAKLAGKNGAVEASSGSSGADVLRAQLAALEQEAKILGIDPNAADDGGYSTAQGWYRGRGGGHRGRGFAPRGRGAFRGQSGRHATYAQFSIDNRPKKLTVAGVDFTPPEKDEQLRHFLLNLGDFESVDTTPSATHVSFRDRKTAEKFYYSLHGKELPGVEGKLELSWVSTPLPPVEVKNPVHEETGAMVSEDPMTGVDDRQAEAHNEQGTEGRTVNMDYEVGDDYEWGE